MALKYKLPKSPKDERAHSSHQESGIVPQKGSFTLQVGPAHFSIGHGGDYVLGQQPDEEWACQVKECQMACFPSLAHDES